MVILLEVGWKRSEEGEEVLLQNGIDQFAILVDNLTRPFHKVLDALARRLNGSPKFKVLDSIVGSAAIFMVDVLAGSKRPSDMFGHYQAMLINIAVVLS
jgi:hypothetical protein